MNVGLINNSFSGITGGKGAVIGAKQNGETAKFSDLIERLRSQNDGKSTVASSQIMEDGRLNGDYSSGFSGTFTGANNKAVLPTGAAANQANVHVKPVTIDKTSKLYEKSMELESFFVKQMLSSMKKTIIKSGQNDFAQETYEDMLYDEYATSMTKNAGFGLADQIYMSLV